MDAAADIHPCSPPPKDKGGLLGYLSVQFSAVLKQE